MSEWWTRLGNPQGAWISPCGLYRHLLWRSWGAAPPSVFVWLNPSTADGLVDDPTVRRGIGFAKREGSGGLIVANVSPFRATDPKNLLDSHKAGIDIFDADRNRDALELARSFGPFVVGWGASIPDILDRAAFVVRRVGGDDMRCLGRTKMGEPRHPLYLAKTTPLEAFP